MIAKFSLQPRSAFRLAMLLFVMIAAFLLSTVPFQPKELVSASAAALRKSTGYPQLISYEPLPREEGEMCEWMPASASASLVATLRQERRAGRAASAEEKSQPVNFSQRKPVRMIRDPYAAYSAIAVDPANNEVVLTDENLFNILVYDRTANTPPTAKMTEPKRMIGGLQTKIEFQCGLYIDPTNGDIYADRKSVV